MSDSLPHNHYPPPAASSVQAADEEPILAELVAPRRYARRRRYSLPLVLFFVTCLSTFWAGACGEHLQLAIFGGVQIIAQIIAEGWRNGLIYMTAVMGILLAHEMGHFVQALRYRVPASLPFFIPMPLTQIGTMGAVIGMQGSHADRKQMFDIGLTGPLAGLVVALPITWLGIRSASVTHTAPLLEDPLIVRLLIHWLRPELAAGEYLKFHPLCMAGWVGMLITGLNMLPISQLDGGHVAYAMFGRRAHWLARGLVFAAGLFILITGEYGWMVMLMLIMFIGPDHPPTANDRVPLGWWRYAIGGASLAIPVLCFTPFPMR